MLKLPSIMHLLFVSLHGNIDLGVSHFQTILPQAGKFKCFVFACQVGSFFFFLELALFFKMLCLGSKFWLLPARSRILSVG